MSYIDSEIVEIAADIVHETEAAWLIFDGTKEVWLPKSQCSFTPSRGDNLHGVFDVPIWLASKRGLI